MKGLASKFLTVLWLAAGGLGYGCGGPTSRTTPRPTPAVQYPGATWAAASTPQSVGWSAEKLAIARAYSDTIGSAAVTIVQHGAVVSQWGEPARRFWSHSMRKSLLSALYGIYVAEGKIDVEETIGHLGIEDTPPPLSDVEKQARVVDLLRARSGIYHPALAESQTMKATRPARYSHPPGTFWYYNNWDFNVLGTIFSKKTGLGIGEAFYRRIAVPIGMEDFRPEDVDYKHETGTESIHPAYPFRITARDLARFGLLYLRKGKWNGKQVVPEAWINRSTTPTECVGDTGAYEFLFWLECDHKHFPGVDLGGGAFSAQGFRGHYVLIVPAHDLVVVHRVNTDVPEGRVTPEQFGHLLKLILNADTSSARRAPAVAEDRRLNSLKDEFEILRRRLGVPGMSAAVVTPEGILWAGGFGYADLEGRMPATRDTPYPIASLTKTFAATLLMQLVEAGRIDLTEPISKYSKQLTDPQIQLRHVLTHTSEGTLGQRFVYNGARFAELTPVIETGFGRPFRQIIADTFFEPLQMGRSVPSHDIIEPAEQPRWEQMLGQERVARYAAVLYDLAKPYRYYAAEEIVRSSYPRRGVSAAAGIISTVVDLSRYSRAIDAHRFLRPAAQERAWTPTVSTTGDTLPYALGWFSQHFRGVRAIWHYGYWPDAFSALILKLPDRAVTLLLLANSDGLSAPFYRTGGVETSAFACSFLRNFAFSPAGGDPIAPPDWQADSGSFRVSIDRIGARNPGYGYECDRTSYSAMAKWLTDRRQERRLVVPLDSTAAARFANRYDMGNGQILTMRVQGRKLVGETTGPPSPLAPFELFADSDHTFFAKAADLQLSFRPSENTAVTGVELTFRGQRRWLPIRAQ